MKAVNINDSTAPFTDYILSGVKTIETRNTNSLKSLVGQRVGIIRTGLGKAVLVGFVTISGVIIYESEREFRKDESRHLVAKGSRYDLKTIKYGYLLTNPERLSEPEIVKAKGIVIRNI